METENQLSATSSIESTSGQRSRSSNRMRYEVEADFLRQQNGSLEQIRNRLGLSRRKICQLLLVDPSAWTRWTQGGGSAPPHIYKALDWYISILEKDPEYRRLSLRFAEWLNQEKEYSGRLAWLEEKIKDDPSGVAKIRGFRLPIVCLAIGALIGFLIFRLSH